MPDLSRDAIAHWLDLNGSDAIDSAIRDTRPPDAHPDVDPVVIRLGTALDAARDGDRLALSALLGSEEPSHRLAASLAHMSPGRRMRVLHWLDEAIDPKGASRVLNAVMSGPRGSAGAATRSWVLHLHRRELLDRLFAEERLATLLTACRAANHQEQQA